MGVSEFEYLTIINVHGVFMNIYTILNRYSHPDNGKKHTHSPSKSGDSVHTLENIYSHP